MIYGLIPRKSVMEISLQQIYSIRLSGDAGINCAQKHAHVDHPFCPNSSANDVPAVCICLHLARTKFYPSLQSFTAGKIPTRREELIFGAKTNFDRQEEPGSGDTKKATRLEGGCVREFPYLLSCTHESESDWRRAACYRTHFRADRLLCCGPA